MCYYVTYPVSRYPPTSDLTVHNYLKEVLCVVLYDGKLNQHTAVVCGAVRCDDIVVVVVVVVVFHIRLQYF